MAAKKAAFRSVLQRSSSSSGSMFSSYIEPGEIGNLPAYNYYTRLAAVHSQEPLSGQTLLLETEGNETVRDEIVKHSRKKFTGKREEISERKSSSGSLSRKAIKTNKAPEEKITD